MARDSENVALRVALAEECIAADLAKEGLEHLAAAADLLEAEGDIERWIKVGERIAFVDPSMTGVTMRVVRVLLARSEPAKALGVLRSVFDTDPDNVETLVLMGYGCLELDMLHRVRQVLARIRDLSEVARAGTSKQLWDEVSDLEARCTAQERAAANREKQ